MSREEVTLFQKQPLKLPVSVLTQSFLTHCVIQLQKILSPDLMEAKGICIFRAGLCEFIDFKSTSGYYNYDSWITWSLIPKLLIAELQYWRKDHSIYSF